MSKKEPYSLFPDGDSFTKPGRKQWVRVFREIGGRLRVLEPWVRAIGWELARTSDSEGAIVTEDEFSARSWKREPGEEDETRQLYRRAVAELGRSGFLAPSDNDPDVLVLASMDSIKVERQDRRLKRESIGNAVRFDVLAAHGFSCRYCGRKAPNVELHVEHVIPISNGGTNDRKNLVPACADCNAGKHVKFVTLSEDA